MSGRAARRSIRYGKVKRGQPWRHELQRRIRWPRKPVTLASSTEILKSLYRTTAGWAERTPEWVYFADKMRWKLLEEWEELPKERFWVEPFPLRAFDKFPLWSMLKREL